MQKAPLQIWCSHDILLEQLQVTVHVPHSASLPVACSHARTKHKKPCRHGVACCMSPACKAGSSYTTKREMSLLLGIWGQCLGCAQVQGKSWSKLVQGRKCGQLIRSDEAIDKSPAQMCVNNSVRLALERPLWTSDITHMFPHRFKVQPFCQSKGMHAHRAP